MANGINPVTSKEWKEERMAMMVVLNKVTPAVFKTRNVTIERLASSLWGLCAYLASLLNPLV